RRRIDCLRSALGVAARLGPGATRRSGTGIRAAFSGGDGWSRRQSCFLLTADHLAGKREVRESAPRLLVVKQHRPAERWRLREADVARNDRAEDLVAEMHEELRADLVREVVSRVEHGAQDTLDLQLRVGGDPDLLD